MMWAAAWKAVVEANKDKCKCPCQCDQGASETLVRQRHPDLPLCTWCYKEWIDPTRIWVGGRDD